MNYQAERSSLDNVSSSFVAARDSAVTLRALFLEAGVPLHPQSSLAKLIDDAIALADAWQAGGIVDDTDPLPLIRGQHLDKIAWAALPLANEPRRAKHLADLRRGTLDPLQRDRSLAKDKLWELELWTDFNRRRLPARLEEPDIIVATPLGDIAVACKRIYSLNNVSNTVSKGVKQIEATSLPGIVAISIEDVAIPAGQLVDAPNIELAAASLNECNRLFMNMFNGCFLKYLATGRAACVAVSTCAALYLHDEGIRECRQTQFWLHPALDEAKKRQMASLESVLFGS
jgi:hypothetical protein